ncbi:MAG: hypothetical protein RLZ92_2115 [Pseudomonadota bacterium]|jgi:hypothetical protein
MQTIQFIARVLLLFSGFGSSWALDAEQASAQVKNLPCKDNLTVEQTLDQSIKSHSQRDIGWRQFQEDDYIDIERAVLINKSMEMRYRWRVKADNSITPQSDRAEKLCSSE